MSRNFFFSGNFPPNEKTTSNQIFLKFFSKFDSIDVWNREEKRPMVEWTQRPKWCMQWEKKIDYEIQFICHQRQKMNFLSLNKFIFSWNESKYEEKRNWKKLPLCFQRIFTYKKKVSIFFRCCCCQFDPIPVCVCVCRNSIKLIHSKRISQWERDRINYHYYGCVCVSNHIRWAHLVLVVVVEHHHHHHWLYGYTLETLSNVMMIMFQCFVVNKKKYDNLGVWPTNQPTRYIDKEIKRKI